MFDLRRLGWNDELARAFGPHAQAGLVPGRVSVEHNHVYRVLTADGEWLAEAAGRMKHEASGRRELPVVGDWVGLRPLSSGLRAVIQAILPRRSHLSRKVAGIKTDEQVLVANIDTVFVVVGLDADLKPRSLERYLVLAARGGVQPVVVLNKSDLCPDIPAALATVSNLAPEVPVVAISARDGTGFGSLGAYLTPGRTAALLGPSGVGKSSIINRLVGHALLTTADVRESDRRGRHTSVHRHLVWLETGGLLVDTPGMRELQLWSADHAGDDTFGDIATLAQACRFRDCRHEQEPGCAVKAAAASGQLDPGRYASYVKLRREHAVFERKQDERAQMEGTGQRRTPRQPRRVVPKGRDQ